MMIERSISRDSSDIQLAKLYFQLGLMLHNAWLKKEQLSKGNLLVESLNALDSALAHISNFNQSIPLVIETLSVRGFVLKMLGKGQEALASYEQALIYPLHKLDLSSLHYCKADVYLMLGQLSSAIEHYEQAIALVPCRTERYHGLTTALSEQNQLTPEQWKTYTKRLIQAYKNCKEEKRRLSDPAAIDFASSFNDYDDYQEGDVEPEEIESFDDDSSSPNTNQKPYLHGRSSESLFANKDGDLLFSIYSAAEKAQETTLAWNYLLLANAAERKSWDQRGQGFDKQQAVAGLNSSIMAFRPSLLRSMPDISHMASPFPIFLVGFMRCGSTLLETMLDAHPKIWGMGEDSIFNRDLSSLRDQLAAATDREEVEDLLVGYGDRVVKEMKHMAALTLNNNNNNNNNNSSSTCNNFSDHVNTNNKVKKLRRVVDKMLFNYRNLPFVHLVYPAAPILHLVRDPLDTLFSCFKLKFDDQGLSWSQSISDLVLVFALYIEQVHHYRRLLPKDRITDLRYEQLVSQPEATLKRVMDKIQLPWDERMLQYHSSGRAVHTHSMTQVRRPLYKGSIGGWRKYGPQLLTAFKKEWMKYLPRLREMGALPFDGSVNWDMDPDFDYDRDFSSLSLYT